MVAGGASYARRLGTTIFLHSRRMVSPVVLRPRTRWLPLTPAGIRRRRSMAMASARSNALMRAWFLEFDGSLSLQTEPSLNKIVEDETKDQSVSPAPSEIDTRIRAIWRAGYPQATGFFPVMPNDLTMTPANQTCYHSFTMRSRSAASNHPNSSSGFNMPASHERPSHLCQQCFSSSPIATRSNRW